MPTDQPKERTRVGAKSARLRDAYCKLVQKPHLSDQQVDEMRKHVSQLARTICEHVWGKRFY